MEVDQNRRGSPRLKRQAPLGDSRALLRPKSRGTGQPGRLLAMACARPIESTAETRAAVTTMAGSAATPKVERKSASRVAFPAS